MKSAGIILVLATIFISQAMGHGSGYRGRSTPEYGYEEYGHEEYGKGGEYDEPCYDEYDNHRVYGGEERNGYHKSMNKYDSPCRRTTHKTGYHERSYEKKDEPKYEIGSVRRGYEPYAKKDQKYDNEGYWPNVYDNNDKKGYGGYHEEKPKYGKEAYEPEYHRDNKGYRPYKEEPKYGKEAYEPEYHRDNKGYRPYKEEPKYGKEAYEPEYHRDKKEYRPYKEEPKYKRERLYESRRYPKNDYKPGYHKEKKEEPQVKYGTPYEAKNSEYNTYASYNGHPNYPDLHDVEYLKEAEKEAKKQVQKLRNDLWSTLIHDRKDLKNEVYSHRPQVEYKKPNDYKVLGY